MITLATIDLRDFFKRSSFVKPNNMLQILGYIHLHCAGGIATLSKTNGSASISLTVDARHEAKEMSLLLDERILSNLCKATNAPEITIEAKGDTIFITDGRTRLSFSNEDVTNFPNRHEWNNDAPAMLLSEDVLQAIGVASRYITYGEGNTLSHFSFVHLAKHGDLHDVGAFSQYAWYIHSFEQELPQILLSGEACAALSGLKEAEYQLSGNVDLFKADGAVYGFTQQQFSTPAYQGIIANAKRDGGFLIQKEHLTRFCELSMGATPAAVTMVEMKDGPDAEDGGKTLHLHFEDTAYRVSNTEDVPCMERTEIEPYSFNAKLYHPALKALPYDAIMMCRMGNAMAVFTPEDAQYVGLLSGFSNS